MGPITPEGVPTDGLKGLTVLLGEDDVVVTTFRNPRDKVYRRRTRRASR